MNTATQTKRAAVSLIGFLRLCCVVGEIAICVAAPLALLLIPLSGAKIAGGGVSVDIVVKDGVFAVNSKVSDKGAGSLSIGPLRLQLVTDAGHAAGPGVSVRATEGIVTVAQPGDAARALECLKWPLILGLLCRFGAGLALLDLIRRMLESVQRREVFTAENIRNVYVIGILFIVSSILKLFIAAWLVSRIAGFVNSLLPQGKAVLESISDGNLVGAGAGLMILALAEVFRQGLTLKEDNQLTI